MPNINKVVYGNTTLIDLTDSTLNSADQLLQGVTAYDRSGTKLTGTASGGGGIGAVTQDANGYVVLDNGEPYSQDITINDNGTYNVAGYGHAIVAVSGGVTPTGNINITQSGQTDVTNYATATVAAQTLPTSASASATSGYTSKATISRSTSDQYINIPTGFNDSGAYYKVNAVANGTVTAPSTISGSSATVSTGTNTLTLSKTVSVTPSVTTAGYVSSGTAGNSNVSLTASVTTQAAQTIYPSTSDQTINSGRYLTGTQTIKGVAVSNTLTADNIKSGVTITIGDSADADRITSVTGTYSGGGGSSKNTQTVQSTSRVTSTSLTRASGQITVATTGTYDVYWTATRSSTSGTWSTRMYIGTTASGSEQSTWSNHVQTVHLSNVSLTANQVVSVYARSRGSNYYAYVPQLTIVQA